MAATDKPQFAATNTPGLFLSLVGQFSYLLVVGIVIWALGGSLLNPIWWCLGLVAFIVFSTLAEIWRRDRARQHHPLN